MRVISEQNISDKYVTVTLRTFLSEGEFANVTYTWRKEYNTNAVFLKYFKKCEGRSSKNVLWKLHAGLLIIDFKFLWHQIDVIIAAISLSARGI